MNNTLNRLSRMSVGNVTFRSELKEILQNKYVLYAILIIAVLNVVGYLALKNMDAVLFFILIVLLTMYFTRNMIVVLFIAVIATNFYSGTRGIIGLNQEGLENENKKDKKNAAPGEAGNGEGEETDAGDAPAVENVEEAAAPPANSESAPAPDAATKAGTDDKEPQKKKDKAKATAKAGMQNLKPAKFKPSKKDAAEADADADADDDDDDDDDGGHAKVTGSKGNRVDYAQTLGQAYDNLQNIVGKDGVKGLTNQTKDLMEQQKVLMNNMKDMEPLIKSAQGFMGQIMGSGGLDGISKMFDGKLFGAVAPTLAENGKSLETKKK